MSTKGAARGEGRGTSVPRRRVVAMRTRDYVRTARLATLIPRSSSLVPLSFQ
jgi:hypothetical protein